MVAPRTPEPWIAAECHGAGRPAPCSIRWLFPVLAGLLAVCFVSAEETTPAFRVAFEWQARGTDPDTVAGTILYVAADTALLRIHRPLRQVMLVAGQHLLLYYPDDGRATWYSSSERIGVPFVEALLRARRSDFGLVARGYSLEGQAPVRDGMAMRWLHERDAAGPPRIEVVLDPDGVVRRVTTDDNGGAALRQLFDGYRTAGSWRYPGRIVSSVRIDTVWVQTGVLEYAELEPSVAVGSLSPEGVVPDSISIQAVPW